MLKILVALLCLFAASGAFAQPESKKLAGEVNNEIQHPWVGYKKYPWGKD
jgi:hypothetical protein